MATQVVGGVRTLTATHDLTIVNAEATGFSKDPVAFVLPLKAVRDKKCVLRCCYQCGSYSLFVLSQLSLTFVVYLS